MISAEDINKDLQQCMLFNEITARELALMFKRFRLKLKRYQKDDCIAMQGEECSGIGIVIEGSAVIKKYFASGKTITIAAINPVNIFGEALVFSLNNKYPSTIVSAEKSLVAFIDKETIIELCAADKRILHNYLGMLSNKMLMLVEKIEYLSYQTIRQKIAAVIIDEYQKQKQLTLFLQYTRKEMAERLGVTRPSLSRELINMKKDGLIDYHKKRIDIPDFKKLEDVLL